VKVCDTPKRTQQLVKVKFGVHIRTQGHKTKEGNEQGGIEENSQANKEDILGKEQHNVGRQRHGRQVAKSEMHKVSHTHNFYFLFYNVMFLTK